MRALSIALILLVAAAPAYAQSDLDVVSQAVPPNVMILLDNSGSMSHAMWHDDFDPNVFYDVGTVIAECDIGSVAAIAGSEGTCPGSGDALDRCPDNASTRGSGDHVHCNTGTLPGGCAAAPAGWSCWNSSGRDHLVLPEFTSGASTRWSRNYLSWLVGEMLTGTTPAIPMVDRIDTARDALLALVDLINPDGQPENVRFGLANFKSGSDPDGGLINEAIASGNKASLISAINGAAPTTWTPLAETLVDIAENMSGDDSVGSCAASGTISSPNPMQDAACRKNFVVILTDGEPTKDDFSNGPGTADFVCAIGNADGDTNESPDAYSGRDDMPPYQDSGTDWLDDVAYQLYNTDLRTDLDGTQNIVTYTVGFTIDHPLLLDTATNSTGEYFIASNANELATTLEAALVDIIERSTSFTATTVPASRTAFADGMFVAWFNPRPTDGFWEGHLEAYRLSPALEILDKDGAPVVDASNVFIEPRNPYWDVYETLRDPAHPPRQLLTNKGAGLVAFTQATIDAADMALLDSELTLYPNDPAVPFADTEELADALVDYLYGHDRFDKDRDGNTAELRDAVLGDIFHSNPLVIGPPPPSLRNEQGFGPLTDPNSFLYRYKQRSRRLYAGANDGMLHAIEAGNFQTGDNPDTPEPEQNYYDLGTGNEQFAYIPGFLLDKLKLIPRNVPRTEYYVDGSPSAADAWLASSAADTDKDWGEWATVLVSGMREGGDGYAAFDVTDPAATTGPHGPYPKLLWELADPSLPLGETWSEPVLTRIKVAGGLGFGDHCGVPGDDGDCRERWVAIFAGGYRPKGDPNLATWVSNPSSGAWTDDSKAVFVVDLKTGQVLAQLAYDGSDPQLSQMVYSLPSTPAVLDLDFDGFADVLYVGDTGGQLWKWDLSALAKDLDGDGQYDTWPAGVFFRADPQAVSSGGLHHKSIFYPPVATFLSGQLVLAFGTGERTDLTYQGDASSDENNRFYRVRDPDPLGPSSIPALPYTEADLTDVTLLAGDPDPADLGFYIVAEEGEKFVTNHAAFGGVLITSSYIPDDGSGDVCDAAGQAYVHIFDLASGQGFFDPASSTNQARRTDSGLGVPSDPRITISGSVDGGVQILLKSSSGQLLSIDASNLGPEPVDLVYWRQRF